MATAHRIAPASATPQLGPLGWIALIPAIAVLAHGEWSLAVACGVHPYVAVGVPAALDIYAIRALRAGREVLPVVLVMVAVNGASHLVSTGLVAVTPGLVIACSAIPAYVLWRVHAIGTRARTDAPADAQPVDATGPSALPRVLIVPAPRTIAPPRPEAAPLTLRPTPHMPVIGAPAPLPAALWDTPIPDGLDPAARVVAQLYRHLRRQPVTSEIEDALKAAGLKHGDGTCREARKRAKAGDETLAAYPLRPDLAAVATA